VWWRGWRIRGVENGATPLSRVSDNGQDMQ
jgi:hypothetical protein